MELAFHSIFLNSCIRSWLLNICRVEGYAQGILLYIVWSYYFVCVSTLTSVRCF